MADVRGRDQIDATIAAVQQQFPGFVFTSGTTVDAYHNLARFTWGLGPSGREPIVEGFDVLVLDDSGQIAAVHGFLDRVPARTTGTGSAVEVAQYREHSTVVGV